MVLFARKANGIPVGLILDIGDQPEHRLAGTDGDLLVFRPDSPGAVPVVFHHAENGDLQSELLRHPFGHRYLPRAAIYQPQVGQDLKAVLFAGLGRFAVVGQPAGKHLLHRGVIIGRCLVLYREFLIQPFFGPSPAEYRHPAHNGLPANIGNIERLDMIRRVLQSQQPPQLGQRRYLLAGAVGIPGQLLRGIILRHLAQLAAFAPLRHRKLNLLPPVLPQQLLQQRPVGQLPLQEDLGRGGFCLHVVAQQEFGHHFLRFAHAVKGKVLLIPQAALPQHQQRAIDLILPLHPAQHIQALVREFNDLLLLGDAPNGGNAVAVACRPLKVQCLRRLLHPLGQLLHRLHPAGADKL